MTTDRVSCRDNTLAPVSHHTVSRHMGCEADPCGASSATDVAYEGAQWHGFRAGLGGGIFLSSALV